MPDQFHKMTWQHYKWYADGVMKKEDRVSGDLRRVWAIIHDSNVSKRSDTISDKPHKLRAYWPLITDRSQGAIITEGKEDILKRLKEQRELSLKYGVAQM